MNRKIWDIRLYVRERKGSEVYRVEIRNGHGRIWIGEGRDAREAHRSAELQMLVKPWVSTENCYQCNP